MAKKTRTIAQLYPWTRGLNKQSVPGTQPQSALDISTNVILNNRGSLKKRPGVRRIDYIGTEEGNLQAAIHFFATSGGAQRSEIFRIIGGRAEAIRDGQAVDLGLDVDPTDAITFSRFANALIIHFENTRPKFYTIGGTLQDLGILSGHEDSPPAFSRVHDFRLWYSGRPAAPHTVYVSAINDIQDYTLLSGGFSMRINDGDGDPQGITGISAPFRGDIFVFKLNSVYRISHAASGYRLDKVTDEVGCVHHNTIVVGQNDVFWVSADGIHSLVAVDKHGAVEEATITAPIYDFFQDNVNWSAAKNMIATYDKPSNCYLLSYASAGSSVNNRVLGFNIRTKEFFEWKDVEYQSISKYFDFGRQKTLIGDNVKGLGILEEDTNTHYGDAINFQATTGIIFPRQAPHIRVSFTKVWFMARPTDKSVKFNFTYWINGNLVDTVELDTFGNGTLFQNTPGGDIGSAIIGTDLIGKNKDQMVIVEAELTGEGNAIQFDIEHDPPSSDPDQSFEIYGLIYEFDYYEDSDVTQQI